MRIVFARGAIAFSLLLFTSATTADAGELYYQMGADGIPMLTDSPLYGAQMLRLNSAKSSSQRTKPINVNGVPRIDAYDHLFRAAADRYDLPAELIKAVCLVESAMNPKAQSPVGAQGLMQLMPQTAKDLDVSDPFDPGQAINGGARYLAQQLRSFGRTDHALAAYNAGPGAVRRAGGIPNYQETQRYVKKVTRYYQHFQSSRPVAKH
jgi:soluble lytic murein transglycosylase-like protein